ncbi:MAG: HD domain-containing phosphohydrolase [Planctomycetota bacterium]
MARQIKNRWVLVGLVAAGQLVILLVGSVWLISWLDATISDAVRDRVLLIASSEVDRLATAIDQLDLESADPESADGNRLQAFLDNYVPPRGGSVYLVHAEDGTPIGLQAWRDRGLTDLVVQHAGSEQPMLALGRGTMADSGVVNADDTDWFIATRVLNDVDARLLFVHRERDVRADVAPVIGTMRAVTFLIAGVVVLSSIVLTTIIMRRYENRLAHVNSNLHKLVDMRTRALLKSRSAVIEGLAKLAESRDDETGQHLERIKKYVRVLGEHLAVAHPEVTPEFVDTMEETSALHDIGKVGIPDAVLLSTGKLSADERTIIEKHPLIGGDTILAVRRQWGDDEFLVTACEIIFAHHERWDGAGYPFGLAGDMIPIAARVVALADVYDALTSRRSYKDALSHDDARDIILQGAGSHFDPDVVAAFEARDDDFRRIRDRYAKDWES